MNDISSTDELLLARIDDHADRAAWQEFTSVYRPLIVRIGRQMGLQVADAEGLAQDVLLKVSRKLEHWQPDQSPGSFRRWLRRVARNAAVDSIRRAAPDTGRGGTSVLFQLTNLPAVEEASQEVLRLELERQAFRWAAERIRDEFQPATWTAFWETMIEGRSCNELAEELGKSVGAIYIARTRVLQRLKTEVAHFDWEEVDDD